MHAKILHREEHVLPGLDWFRDGGLNGAQAKKRSRGKIPERMAGAIDAGESHRAIQALSCEKEIRRRAGARPRPQ
jgi:hypothetical protein